MTDISTERLEELTVRLGKPMGTEGSINWYAWRQTRIELDALSYPLAAEVIALREQVARVTGWQAIETYRPEDLPYSLDDVIVSDGQQVTVAYQGEEGWNDSIDASDNDPLLQWQPTHWMPLPAPPKA